MRGLISMVVVGLCATGASAQTTVPNTFTAGTPARASEVNANFAALVASINALTARVAALETELDLTMTPADVAGSYQLIGLQVGFRKPGSIPDHTSYIGTATFDANGTFNFVFAGFANIPTGPFDDSGSASGIWTLTGTTVTLTVAAPNAPEFKLAAAVDGRVLLGTIYGSDDDFAHNNLYFFVRSN